MHSCWGGGWLHAHCEKNQLRLAVVYMTRHSGAARHGSACGLSLNVRHCLAICDVLKGVAAGRQRHQAWSCAPGSWTDNLGHPLLCQQGRWQVGEMRSGPETGARTLMSILTKKPVSSGFATHTMEQQSRVAVSFPVSLKRSPTWRTCAAQWQQHGNHLQ
jgi:hypothetical protein